MPASDDWPGVFELDLLAVEIRLNDPRTVSVTRPPRAAPPENATTTPRRDVVDLLGRADG